MTEPASHPTKHPMLGTTAGHRPRPAWLQALGLCALLAALAACADGRTNSETAPRQKPAHVALSHVALPPDATGMRDLTSVEFTQLMGVGWNIGNNLEALAHGKPSETAWGNPPVSATLINAVAAAGFNTLRVPVAWSQFSNPGTYTIEPAWLKRVEEVVNYALAADLLVIINMHWDGGWMQPTYVAQTQVHTRMAAMWQQIASHFRAYDDRLLFAGTNEVMVSGDYGPPSAEYYTVQNGFNQLFVDTVRATGGRNFFRHLVVQGYNTDITHTINHAVLPKDVIDQRLMMEVHYYDPWEFAGEVKNDRAWQWGRVATSHQATAGWGNEAWVDQQFERMHRHFIARGVGVILGEYGAVYRKHLDPNNTYRTYWNRYVTASARQHGLVPIYWDNGYPYANHSFGLFDRTTGEAVHKSVINAIVQAGEHPDASVPPTKTRRLRAALVSPDAIQ